MSSSPPNPQPNPAPDHEGHSSGGHGGSGHKVRNFFILWIAVFLVETTVAKLGFEEQLVELDHAIASSLQHLDPFAMAHDFYDRWSDPHSVRVWSLAAPLNVRVHDDKILVQMRELRKLEPTAPTEPIVLANRAAIDNLVFGANPDLSALTHTDPAADDLAKAQHQQACQAYLPRYHAWEQLYHQLAQTLTNFDESSYSGNAPGCGEGGGPFSNGLGLSSVTRYFDQTYSPTIFSKSDGAGSEWPTIQFLWERLLGFPDALLYTVESAFGRGFFQATLAVFLLVLAYVVIVQETPILIPVLPLVAGCVGWGLLEIVRGAQYLLDWLLPAPGVPALATAALWTVHGFVDSLSSIVQHNVAHEIAESFKKLFRW